jgi:hypothetical protein
MKLAQVFVGLCLSISSCGVAEAGWFGPSNYDECVLDKLNGQLFSTLQVIAIQNACRDLFPPPPVAPAPILLNKDFIKWDTATNSDGSRTVVRIIEKPSGYNITAVIGGFINRSPCIYNTYETIIDQENEDRNWLRLRGSRLNSPNEFMFSIASNQFNCVDLYFYGTVN